MLLQFTPIRRSLRRSALARRTEAAEAVNARGCTAVCPEAAVLEIAGGRAIFRRNMAHKNI